MKWYLLLIFLLSVSLSARVQESQSYQALEAIKPYAMELGVGKTEVFVFVDPMCPKSREYISLISRSGNLLRRQHFYIFLLHLERFDSEHLIRTIYESANPRLMMQKVMIERCAPQILKGERRAYAQAAIDAITIAGIDLDIRQRPSLLIIKPGSPYCTVSEGEPDCAAPGVKKR